MMLQASCPHLAERRERWRRAVCQQASENPSRLARMARLWPLVTRCVPMKIVVDECPMRWSCFAEFGEVMVPLPGRK